MLTLEASGLTGCQAPDAKAWSGAAVIAGAPAAEGVPVRLAKVIRARRLPPIHAVGTLAAKEEVKLSFKLGGLIEKLDVEEGATVRAGQRLATLRLPEIDAGVAQAREGVAKAERDRARVEALYEGKAATLEQVQNARTAVEVAQAALSAATFNRAHAMIEAPADGKIVRRLAEKDETVAPGSPIFVFRSARRGWVVRAGVSDRDVVRLAIGDGATVCWTALPARPFAATVSEIAESASPLTGTYELELRLKDVDPALRAGLIADVRLQPVARETFAFVPLEALQEGEGQQASVFVPSGDGRHVEKRAVTLAFIDAAGTLGPTAGATASAATDRAGSRVEAAVAAGLEGISEVVVAGAGRLFPGSAIALADAGDSGSSRPTSPLSTSQGTKP
jgi:RND family efflux transporter MFP subunit